MIFSILQVIVIFIVPIIIIKKEDFFVTKIIGTIGSAYLLGILVAVIMYYVNSYEINIEINTDVSEIGAILAISIAIPLLLFSANLKEAKKLSKTVLLSFGSLVISTLIVSAVTFYLFGNKIEYGAELSGMAVGLYTGGTPNLNAIANIFALNSTTLSVANLSDIVIGAVFYIFLLTLAKPLLSLFLRKSDHDLYIKEESSIKSVEDINLEQFKISKELMNRFFLAFGITILGAILGVLLWLILGAEDGKMNDLLVPVVMITVTVLGIILSFNEKIRKTKGMSVLGQYFILVFSFALASSLDFSIMEGIFNDILLLYGIITIGVLVLHAVISKLLNADVDVTITTLTAGLYGPAFVPAITKQLKNQNLTVPGLIVGSIGYAIGTFLGMILGYLLMI